MYLGIQLREQGAIGRDRGDRVEMKWGEEQVGHGEEIKSFICIRLQVKMSSKQTSSSGGHGASAGSQSHTGGGKTRKPDGITEGGGKVEKRSETAWEPLS